MAESVVIPSHPLFKDLTGQSFGRLTVTSFYGRGVNGYNWICLCECGRACTVHGGKLTSRRRKSCGSCPITQTSFPVHGNFHNITGHRFGRLVVISFADRKNKNRCIRWTCSCDCGNTIITMASHLISGHTNSCGCLAIERTLEAKITHGHTTYNTWSNEYVSWAGMIQRCENPNNNIYFRYGGRGITIDPFFKSFENFIAYMGPSNGLSIERINNDEGYFRGNVKWETAAAQARNRRSNVKIIFNDVNYVLRDAIRTSGKSLDVYYALLKTGLTPQEAFNLTPLKGKKGGDRKSIYRHKI